MNWFRTLLVAAVICATVAVGTWGVYAVAGAALNETALVIALVAAMLALVLGGAAAVSRALRPSTTARSSEPSGSAS